MICNLNNELKNNFLISTKKLSLENLLNLMMTAKIDFHLTGSYFFGNQTSESDMDFFTYESLNLQTFLKDLYFIRIESNYITSDYSNTANITSVWEYTTSDNKKVQIQILNSPRDLVNKIKVQSILFIFKDYFNQQNKEERKRMWNELLTII